MSVQGTPTRNHDIPYFAVQHSKFVNKLGMCSTVSFNSSPWIKIGWGGLNRTFQDGTRLQASGCSNNDAQWNKTSGQLSKIRFPFLTGSCCEGLWLYIVLLTHSSRKAGTLMSIQTSHRRPNILPRGMKSLLTDSATNWLLVRFNEMGQCKRHE
jgi:hypothetical protein